MDNREIQIKITNLFSGTNWIEDGEGIWFIMSALRGPDSGHEALKDRTTWRLRKALDPNFFYHGASFIDGIGEVDKPRPDEVFRYQFVSRLRNELTREFPFAQSHFIDHYGDACWFYWKIYG